MILRRISSALKRQDWTTVAIEFILVVSGVLVALQVNNWNEERIDREDEAYYLGRILADIDESIASNNESIEFLEDREEHTSWVAGKLRSGTLPAGEKQLFEERLLAIGDWRVGGFVDSTIQELQSSGRMTIIQSKTLREQLGRFELKLESHRRARDNIADLQKGLELEITGRIDSSHVKGEETLISSFDALKEDAALLRYIERHAFFYRRRIENVRLLQDNLTELREHTVRASEGYAAA